MSLHDFDKSVVKTRNGRQDSRNYQTARAMSRSICTAILGLLCFLLPCQRVDSRATLFIPTRTAHVPVVAATPLPRVTNGLPAPVLGGHVRRQAPSPAKILVLSRYGSWISTQYPSSICGLITGNPGTEYFRKNNHIEFSPLRISHLLQRVSTRAVPVSLVPLLAQTFVAPLTADATLSLAIANLTHILEVFIQTTATTLSMAHYHGMLKPYPTCPVPLFSNEIKVGHQVQAVIAWYIPGATTPTVVLAIVSVGT